MKPCWRRWRRRSLRSVLLMPLGGLTTAVTRSRFSTYEYRGKIVLAYACGFAARNGSWQDRASSLPRSYRSVGPRDELAGSALHALARGVGSAQAPRTTGPEHRHLRRRRLARRRTIRHDRRKAPLPAYRPWALALPRDKPPHLRDGGRQAWRLVLLPGRRQPHRRPSRPRHVPPALLRRRDVLPRLRR